MLSECQALKMSVTLKFKSKSASLYPKVALADKASESSDPVHQHPPPALDPV